MKEARLTAAQVLELRPYERNFKQATEAAWCSYPGQAGISKMCDIWESLTGSKYPYQPGCSNCLLNLVRDLGTIYFAQKDSVLAEADPGTHIMPDTGDYHPEAMEEARKTSEQEPEAQEPEEVPEQKKTPAKGKRGSKK